MSDLLNVSEIYRARFDDKELRRKNAMWRILCRDFFQRYVKPTDTVLDLGAGYCEFINNIKCGTRIAVDLNPETEAFARPDVRVILTLSDRLDLVESGTVDIVFVSNFFEHLHTKDMLMETLREIRRVLKEGGRLLILQPNIRVLGGKYWDFVDHHLALTDLTLVEALNLLNFKVIQVWRRFLPYTTKSWLPKSPWLIFLYLKFMPFSRLIFGEQAWVVGEKP